MPQLEIHHADGSVTYAELTQSKPLMIGSGTNCDVVLSDPAIKRVHSRLVWRCDRNEYRVEVAADAGGVQLGGKTVKAGTVRAGDIIGLGNSRIYVDEVAATQAPPPAAGPDLDYDASASLEEAATEERHVTPSTIRKASHLRDQRGIWRKVLDALGRKAKERSRLDERRQVALTR